LSDKFEYEWVLSEDTDYQEESWLMFVNGRVDASVFKAIGAETWFAICLEHKTGIRNFNDLESAKRWCESIVLNSIAHGGMYGT